MVGFSNLELNAVEVFWNGALCYNGFAGVLGESAYLAAKNGGAFDGEDSIDQMLSSGGAHMIAYAVGIPGIVFAAIYAASLPNALAALLN